MNDRKIICVLLAIVLLLIFSCNPTVRKKESDNYLSEQINDFRTIYKRGIINTITVVNNQECSYSFYVPNDSLLSYPVFILLDPQAKGTYVVSLYQQLAEKYDVILISSNSVKNLMSISEIEKNINIIINDAKLFLPIDTQRVYLGGFSGMARAVYQIISASNLYKGAVAIGAGTNVAIPWKDTLFCLIQMAGFKDMNFREVYESNQTLRNVSTLYMSFYYEDSHNWPVDSIMEFSWLNFFAKNKTNMAKQWINSFYQSTKTIPMRDAWKKTLIYQSLQSMSYNLKYYLSPFNEISAYLNTFESKNSIKQLQNVLKTEQKEIEELTRNFVEKDTLWWNKTIKFYKEVSQKRYLSPLDYKDIRLANYISLLAYSYTRNALQQNRMDWVKKYLYIYRQIDPYNPDMLYFWSIYFAKLNEHKRSIDSLNKAIKLGFSNKAMIENETAFNSIRDSARFIEITSKINR